MNLPLLDEPFPPVLKRYTKPHTLVWSERVDSFDGFVLVTPEYNHGVAGALKKAIDFLYQEWTNKVVGFVGYGNAEGARAIGQCRQIVAELQMADVGEQVSLNLFTDFENYSVFKPAAHDEQKVNTMLDQVVSWSTALKK